jgi:hypothetical protein
MRMVLAGLLLASATILAGAQTLSPEDIARRTIERRDVEAAIWGMPAVSMAGIRKSLAGIGADYNQVVYFSQPLEARHEFLTANNQTPYVLTVLDLHRGPVILELPPASSKVALFGSVIDSWEVPLVDVGPAGEDAGKGGKYLFLPPGYTGARPDGHIVVPSPTYFVHAGLRPIILGQGTLADGVAYSQTMKVYPLAEASNPQTRYIDAYPKPWKTLPVYDLTFFRDLAAVVNDEPAQEKDALMLGYLASIGIEKGKPFNPTGEQARAFERAAQDAYAYMQDIFTTPGKLLAPHWPDRQWMDPNLTQKQDFTFVVDGKLLVDERAANFLWATWLPKKLGAASAYPTALRDGAGKLPLGPEQLPASGDRRHARARFLVGYRLQHEDQVDDPQSAKSRWPILLRQVEAADERGR